MTVMQEVYSLGWSWRLGDGCPCKLIDALAVIVFSIIQAVYDVYGGVQGRNF
jgi:hypothetical protein